jgi:exodeoxyribonuclease VII large subunit
MQAMLSRSTQDIVRLRRRLKSPVDLVSQWKDKQSGLELRLRQSLLRYLEQVNSRFQNLDHRLSRTSPEQKIIEANSRMAHLNQRLESSIHRQLEPRSAQFQRLVSKLNVLSPLSTLERGYSITRSEESKVIQSTQEVTENQEIETLLRDGKIISTVKSVLK